MLPSFFVRAKTQRRKEVCIITVRTALFVITRNLKFEALRAEKSALCAFASLREIFTTSATKTSGVV
jgi:hypothetical protein